MDSLSAVYKLGFCLCCPKPATKRGQLCAACYMAVWRRVKLGEPLPEAIEDRRFMLRRRRANPKPAISP